MEGFEYIVNPPIIPKVAFGSGLERETLPLRGPNLNNFMRTVQGEIRDFPGPLDYTLPSTLEREFPSKYGFSGFVSKTNRDPERRSSLRPPIGAYDIGKKKPPKQMAKPFNVGSKRGPPHVFLTPAPTAYPVHIPIPKLRVNLAFGTRRKFIPAYTVFCKSYNTFKCNKCGQTPYGDFWHDSYTKTDLCRLCTNKMIKVAKNCKTDLNIRVGIYRHLCRLKPVRYCSFFHEHKGTTAATQIMPTKTLRKKITKENYFYLYFARRY